jgi:hypothetical protein
MTKRFEISEETRTIKGLLSKAAEGEMVPYGAITKAVGLNAQTRCMGYIATARRHLLQEKGYVFRAEENLGLRRLTNEQKEEEARKKAKRARNNATQGEKIMIAIDWDDLTQEQVREATATRMILAIQRNIATRGNRGRLNSLSEKIDGKALPPPANVMKTALEAMTGDK